MTTNEVATNEIPELIESIEPMLTAPDPALIRAEAVRRRTLRHRVGALGAMAAVVAILGAVTTFGGDEPTQTETAAAGLSSTTSPPTTGLQNPANEFDARRALAGNTFRVRSTDNAPIELRPNIGHLGFDDTDGMVFTVGCEGASYRIDWTSSGYVVERANPDPAVAAGVACIGTSLLSPFREGDVVDVRPGDAARSFDLTVLGQTTWTMSVSEPEDEDTAVDETEFPRWEEVDSRIGGDNSPTVYGTGDNVLVLNTENWGSDIVGELWDPATNTATEIAATGLAWRVGAATAWTGEELLLVGGSNGPGIDRVAVAYRPETDMWRDLATPPGIEGESTPWVGEGFWTGEEFVVPQQSVAYDLATDTWHAIAQWPFGETRVGLVEGTPDGILVWGGCTGPPQCDETNTGLVGTGAFYSYSDDTWFETSPAPLPPAVHVVGATAGTEVVVVVTDSLNDAPAAAAYDPASDTWHKMPPPPISSRRESAMVLNQNRVIIWGGQSSGSGDVASGAYFDPLEERWRELPDAAQGASFHSMVDLGNVVFASARRPSTPGESRNPQLLRMPETRHAQYRECALNLGVDPRGEQVIFSSNGKPILVKTGVDVPAAVHLPCLAQIGGPALGDVSGSSHSQGIVIVD